MILIRMRLQAVDLDDQQVPVCEKSEAIHSATLGARRHEPAGNRHPAAPPQLRVDTLISIRFIDSVPPK